RRVLLGQLSRAVRAVVVDDQHVHVGQCHVQSLQNERKVLPLVVGGDDHQGAQAGTIARNPRHRIAGGHISPLSGPCRAGSPPFSSSSASADTSSPSATTSSSGGSSSDFSDPGPKRFPSADRRRFRSANHPLCSIAANRIASAATTRLPCTIGPHRAAGVSVVLSRTWLSR